MSHIQSEYSAMSFKELSDMTIDLVQNNPQRILYGQLNSNDAYYNLEDSLYILKEILDFQFGGEMEEIKEFMINLHSVLDKRIPKKNTFLVWSKQSNAGKNVFFDAIVHAFLNYGQLANFNKYCSFPFQDCMNKRIVLWNEPVFEPSAIETLKMFLGGDVVSAKKKFDDDASISRTPVIILANGNPFPEKFFKERMYSYEWNTCPHLIHVKKKVWPASIFYLFKMFNNDE